MFRSFKSPGQFRLRFILLLLQLFRMLFILLACWHIIIGIFTFSITRWQHQKTSPCLFFRAQSVYFETILVHVVCQWFKVRLCKYVVPSKRNLSITISPLKNTILWHSFANGILLGLFFNIVQ